MTVRIAGSAVKGLETLFQWGAIGSWTDSQLMTQFLGDDAASEAAFRVLIHRHGPMVLGVCRRILGDEHAAEDAFQATFVVLVKKARGLRDCNLLSNWLYGVALRIATKEKAGRARRRVVERNATERPPSGPADLERMELRVVIDEEIKRLPERFRVPLVLCHMEGLRHDEVARRLGCPVGTVESRLSRARERLRARLERRGLTPATASMMALVSRSPADTAALPALVESTVRLAIEQATAPAAWKVALASAWGLQFHPGWLAPVLKARAVVATAVACVSLSIAAFAVYRANDERHDGPRKRPEPPPATRVPSAVGYALTGITIDGDIGDWPTDLPRYPIRNQLVTASAHESEERGADQGPDPYFMVGYDRKTELLYLAVVVPDEQVVVHPTDIWGTDSVEVYIDTKFSTRTTQSVATDDWRLSLDAATMPVHQYVAVPGAVPAYNDPWGENPSLLYARTKHTETAMKYQHRQNTTIYEWAIRAFDRYPDEPTQLRSGKRLGLEVAVLDKDQPRRKSYFLTWGAPPRTFKGFDASTLGELILLDDPTPP